MAVSVKRTIIYRVRQKTAKYNFSAKLVPTTAKNSKTRNGVNTQYEWHRKDKITRMTHIYILSLTICFNTMTSNADNSGYKRILQETPHWKAYRQRLKFPEYI